MATGHGIDFQVGGSFQRVFFQRDFLISTSACPLFFGIMVMLLHVFLGGIASVLGSPTFYDQRQSGKTNVRVEVKDAVIIAVGDGELGGDYDYSYDYSDLTIKPGQPSSSTSIPLTPTPAHKPTGALTTTLSTVTANHNLSQNSAIILEAENSSIIFPSIKPGNGSSEAVNIPVNAYQSGQFPVVVAHEIHGNRPNKFLPVKTVEKHYVPSSRIRGKGSNLSAIKAEELPVRHCSPGFFLDDHNRCKRIRRPTRERPQLLMELRPERRSRSRN